MISKMNHRALFYAMIFITVVGVASVPVGCARETTAVAETPVAKSYAADNQVELYGRHRCSICRAFVAELEARQITFRFYDVDQEPERAREMWALIHEHFPDTKSVGLPVVRVNGTVLLRPEFARFENYLKAAR
ncbi:MAG: glutaredoxin domain-containing protein [Leptospirales bacterium]